MRVLACALAACLCFSGAWATNLPLNADTQEDIKTNTGRIVDEAYQPGTAGSPSSQILSIQRIAYVSPITLTRTNDTNAYTANDILGAATGSTAALTFAGIGPANGGQVTIVSAELEIDAAAVISGETSYNLYFYSVTPPSALGDNAAFDIPAGDRASFAGKLVLGTPADEGSTLYIATDNIQKQITVPSGGSLFAYLVTAGAYTPTASRVYKIKLHTMGQ